MNIIGRTVALCGVLALGIGCAGRGSDGSELTEGGHYAAVNGLRMYYEVHGAGAPVVLLHGGFCTIDGCMGAILPGLAAHRQVIAVEMQAHGHTNDIDRPLTYDALADDIAALIEQLGLGPTDVFGYSLGAEVALRLGMSHPERVRRLVALSPASYDNVDPALHAVWEAMTPDAVPALFHDAYTRVAPDPSRWPVLVAKMQALLLGFKGWSPAELASIAAPVLVAIGEHDLVQTAPAEALTRQIAHGQLTVLPGGDHFAIATQPDLVLGATLPFLDAR